VSAAARRYLASVKMSTVIVGDWIRSGIAGRPGARPAHHDGARVLMKAVRFHAMEDPTSSVTEVADPSLRRAKPELVTPARSSSISGSAGMSACGSRFRISPAQTRGQ
jgi:hypothetical protein